MDVYVGFISPFPFNWAPAGWALCNGLTVPMQQYAALYSLIGTQYGGDGRTTIGLPDLRGRQIVGMGQQPGGTNFQIASHGGAEQILLTSAQVPLAVHTHSATFTPGGSGGAASLSVSTATPSAAPPLLTNGQTAYLANAAGGAVLKGLYTTTAPTEGATATIPVNGGGGSGGTVAVGAAGQSATAAVPLMNPFLALNFCIALIGLYPSRN